MQAPPEILGQYVPGNCELLTEYRQPPAPIPLHTLEDMRMNVSTALICKQAIENYKKGWRSRVFSPAMRTCYHGVPGPFHQAGQVSHTMVYEGVRWYAIVRRGSDSTISGIGYMHVGHAHGGPPLSTPVDLAGACFSIRHHASALAWFAFEWLGSQQYFKRAARGRNLSTEPYSSNAINICKK